MRACAIIGIILFASLFAVVSGTLSAINSPDGHQGLVEQFNTTAKQMDLARAALFRSTMLSSFRIDTKSHFGLDARAGGCQCSDIDSKW